jgi:hypothetical protein
MRTKNDYIFLIPADNLGNGSWRMIDKERFIEPQDREKLLEDINEAFERTTAK